MTWTGLDLVAASALAVALFGALLLLALLTRARADILGSPVGWRLVAAALSLFAFRGLMHFAPIGYPDLQHGAGILAALLLPTGLFLVVRAPSEEVFPDA